MKLESAWLLAESESVALAGTDGSGSSSRSDSEFMCQPDCCHSCSGQPMESVLAKR